MTAALLRPLRPMQPAGRAIQYSHRAQGHQADYHSQPHGRQGRAGVHLRTDDRQAMMSISFRLDRPRACCGVGMVTAANAQCSNGRTCSQRFSTPKRATRTCARMATASQKSRRRPLGPLLPPLPPLVAMAAAAALRLAGWCVRAQCVDKSAGSPGRSGARGGHTACGHKACKLGARNPDQRGCQNKLQKQIQRMQRPPPLLAAVAAAAEQAPACFREGRSLSRNALHLT